MVSGQWLVVKKTTQGSGAQCAPRDRAQAFPLRGRWHGEAVTDEVVFRVYGREKQSRQFVPGKPSP